MATTLRDKLKKAIETIDPVALKPGEIASLAKLATEMERKARIDTIAQEEARQPLLVDTGNPELKKNETKKDDLKEVMEQLGQAIGKGVDRAILFGTGTKTPVGEN